MKIFALMNVVFGLLAMGSGAIVLHGILRHAPSRKWTIRFLRYSLLASLVGLLPPTRHLVPIQEICMLSVYCSGAAILAWLKFHFAGVWRLVFAFLITVVLYLHVVSISIQFFNHVPLFITANMQSYPRFEITQLFLAAIFALLGMLAVTKCHPQPTHRF